MNSIFWHFDQKVRNAPDQAIYLLTGLDFNILGSFYSGNLPFGNDRCSNCKRDCKVFFRNWMYSLRKIMQLSMSASFGEIYFRNDYFAAKKTQQNSWLGSNVWNWWLCNFSIRIYFGNIGLTFSKYAWGYNKYFITFHLAPNF